MVWCGDCMGVKFWLKIVCMKERKKNLSVIKWIDVWSNLTEKSWTIFFEWFV